MKFQSHVPSCVDSDPAIPLTEFQSIEQVLEHPWVKSFYEGQRNFKYYWSRCYGSNLFQAMLIAMWDDSSDLRYGKRWWVLGYMDEVPEVLDEWKTPKEL